MTISSRFAVPLVPPVKGELRVNLKVRQLTSPWWCELFFTGKNALARLAGPQMFLPFYRRHYKYEQTEPDEGPREDF